MSKSYGVRGIALLLCVVLTMSMFLVLPSATPVYGASLKDLQATLQNLKDQHAALDKQLAALKNQAQSQIAYRDSLNQKIKNAQEQIDNLNTQIQAYDDQIVVKENEIADTSEGVWGIRESEYKEYRRWFGCTIK